MVESYADVDIDPYLPLDVKRFAIEVAKQFSKDYRVVAEFYPEMKNNADYRIRVEIKHTSIQMLLHTIPIEEYSVDYLADSVKESIRLGMESSLVRNHSSG